MASTEEPVGSLGQWRVQRGCVLPQGPGDLPVNSSSLSLVHLGDGSRWGGAIGGLRFVFVPFVELLSFPQ